METTYKGMPVFFDKIDLPLFEKHSWFWMNGYLMTKINQHGKRRTIGFHRLILGDTPGMHTDHINRIRHDNQRCNLRVCTQAENNRNKGAYEKPEKGVSFRRGKWQVVIKVAGKAKWFGHYDTKDQALMVAQEQFKRRIA